MATLFAENGTCREVFPANGLRFTLAELQALVGGYIELVTIRPPADTDRKATMMFVNEDGWAKGYGINARATRLYQGDPPRHNGLIVGDAVVMTRAEAGED